MDSEIDYDLRDSRKTPIEENIMKNNAMSHHCFRDKIVVYSRGNLSLSAAVLSVGINLQRKRLESDMNPFR
jgi:hypothetical protein